MSHSQPQLLWKKLYPAAGKGRDLTFLTVAHQSHCGEARLFTRGGPTQVLLLLEFRNFDNDTFFKNFIEDLCYANVGTCLFTVNLNLGWC